ncbi:MAG: hypothetical protein LBB18_03295 [Puniceicoccales bacterium]|nr:hypothetical protein [Puniceicoccales bacterium]
MGELCSFNSPHGSSSIFRSSGASLRTVGLSERDTITQSSGWSGKGRRNFASGSEFSPPVKPPDAHKEKSSNTQGKTFAIPRYIGMKNTAKRSELFPQVNEITDPFRHGGRKDPAKGSMPIPTGPTPDAQKGKSSSTKGQTFAIPKHGGRKDPAKGSMPIPTGPTPDAQNKMLGGIGGASTSSSTQKTEGVSTTSKIEAPKMEIPKAEVPKIKAPDPKVARISSDITSFEENLKSSLSTHDTGIVFEKIDALGKLLAEIATVENPVERNVLTHAISSSAFDIVSECKNLDLIEKFLDVLDRVGTDTRPILLNKFAQTVGGSLAKRLVSNIEDCIYPRRSVQFFSFDQPKPNVEGGIKLFDKIFNAIETLNGSDAIEILEGVLSKCNTASLSESTQNILLKKVESFEGSYRDKAKLIIAIATGISDKSKGWQYESTRNRLFQLISNLADTEKMWACKELGCNVNGQCDAANGMLFSLLEKMPAKNVCVVLCEIVNNRCLPNVVNRSFHEKMLDLMYRLPNDKFLELSVRFDIDDIESFGRANMQKFADKLGLICDEGEWSEETFQKKIIEKRNMESPASKYIEVFKDGAEGAKLVRENSASIMDAIGNKNWFGAQKCLCKIPGINELYENEAQVSEGYSVGEHSREVLGQFDYWKEFFNLGKIEKKMRSVPGFSDFKAEEFIMVMLLLHDIGKSVGPSALEQHIFTVPIMAAIMRNLGFSNDQVKLAELIVGNDLIGEFQKSEVKDDQSKQAHRVTGKLGELAHEARVPSWVFCELEYLFYICDASASPNLLSNEMQMDENGQLAFKSKSGKISNASAVKNCFEEAKKDVGGFVEGTLKRDNFDPRMLFDTSEINFENGVFDVANYILENKNLITRANISKKDRETIFEMANFAHVLQLDKFKESYSEDLILSRLAMRGWDSLYSSITNANGFGEHNNVDAQRCMVDFERYCREKIGDHFSATKFFDGFFQTNGEKILAFNLFAASSRYQPLSEYFWAAPAADSDPDPVVAAQEQMENLLATNGISKGDAMLALAMWHALSIELMTRIDLPGKTDDNSIHLLRAENPRVLSNYNISTNSTPDVTRQMPRSPMVYACYGTCATEFGSSICYMKIPIHIIIDGTHMPLEHTTKNTAIYLHCGRPFEYVGNYDDSLPVLHAPPPVKAGEDTATNSILAKNFGFYRTTNAEGELVCGRLSAQ